jgi:CheY-like chemotaxis protein
MMPVMDGYAVAAELERQGWRPGIPIIVITADGRAPMKAAQVHAEGYLAKPFDIDDLIDEVARVIGP